MEITWYGQACIRMRGREGSAVADAYPAVVGPTGRGLTADIAAFSHPDPSPPPPRGGAKRGPSNETERAPSVVVPTSLEPAFLLTGPGEYEIHDILATGVRTARDDSRGAERGFNTAFVFEFDGMHVAHLGDLGHLLSQDQLGEIGSVEVVCVPVGGSLSAGRAAEVVSQLDASLVVPLPVADTEEASAAAMARFFHEMGVTAPTPQSKLTVTISSVPDETTVVLLEQRGRV
jgi:hypothetical protein